MKLNSMKKEEKMWHSKRYLASGIIIAKVYKAENRKDKKTGKTGK